MGMEASICMGCRRPYLFFFIHRLEESPRWHENRGEYAKADAILTRIEEQVEKEKGPLPAASQPKVSETVKQNAGYAGLLKAETSKLPSYYLLYGFLKRLGFTDLLHGFQAC